MSSAEEVTDSLKVTSILFSPETIAELTTGGSLSTITLAEILMSSKINFVELEDVYLHQTPENFEN